MGRAALCLLALLLCSAALAPARGDVLIDDGLDNEDDAGQEVPADAGSGAPPAPRPRPPLIVFKQQDSWLMEGCALGVLLAFLINMLVGRSRNERLAVAWTTELVAPDGVLDRNFALLGPGDTAEGEVLLKESMSSYVFWASGRRFCQGLLATFHLLRRQDLLAHGIQALRGQKDVLELEVRMNEGAMPQLVLAIAQPAIARIMQQDSTDVKSLTKRLEPTRDRIAQWPDKLVVLAEHSSIFYDLMTPQLLDLLFSRDAFAAVRPYFRFLYITSDLPEGPHKQVVRLSFALPPLGDAATLNRFLTAALLLADLLGSYRLSPEQQKRATEARQKKEVAERAAGGDERQQRAEERRLAKEKEEAERLKRMTPDQRARELERKQKLQMKRRMAKMAKRM